MRPGGEAPSAGWLRPPSPDAELAATACASCPTQWPEQQCPTPLCPAHAPQNGAPGASHSRSMGRRSPPSPSPLPTGTPRHGAHLAALRPFGPRGRGVLRLLLPEDRPCDAHRLQTPLHMVGDHILHCGCKNTAHVRVLVLVLVRPGALPALVTPAADPRVLPLARRFPLG